METEKVDPNALVAAMERGGWIRRGGRAGSYVRMSWPPAVSNQGVSILIPLNPEAADYADLLQAVLAQLSRAAERGRAAGEVLASIMREKQAGPVGDDPMPAFVIKGKDQLAPHAVLAYARLCHQAGLNDQAEQVMDAEQEITDWQERHPELVKEPDHQHVPARSQLT